MQPGLMTARERGKCGRRESLCRLRERVLSGKGFVSAGASKTMPCSKVQRVIVLLSLGVGAASIAAVFLVPVWAPAKPWWQDSVVPMSWATLHQAEDRNYLALTQHLRSTIADRGIFCGQYAPDTALTAPEQMRQAADFYRQNGLKVTAFLSVGGWNPAPDAAARLLSVLEGYIDAGCDGVHLDLLFQPATVQNAPAAVSRLRDALHRYGQEKYRREILFTGNVWKLDSAFALQAAAITDVAWIETWGDSDLDLVRIARVARSLGGNKQERHKPVWYHFQPNNDTEGRVLHLVNLAKALFSSCLFEDARFLCNYKYPVPVTVKKPGAGDDSIEWKMFYINEGWTKSLLLYARFADAYKTYLTDTVPQAKVLVAYPPEEVSGANRIMDTLLERGIGFNVLVYGSDPFRPLTPESLQGYTTIVTPMSDAALVSLAPGVSVLTQADALLRAIPQEVDRFMKVQGAKDVIGRVTRKGRIRIVHLKQTGYTDAADGLPRTGPLRITLYAPGITQGFCVSPERAGKMELNIQANGDYATFTIPELNYYALAVLD